MLLVGSLYLQRRPEQGTLTVLYVVLQVSFAVLYATLQVLVYILR